MVKVGDRVRLSSGKASDREGIVTAVTGSMLRVRWPSEEETTVVPAPGTLTVLSTTADRPPTTVRPGRAAPKRAATKSAVAGKTPAKKAVAKNPATKKAGPKKTARRAKRS